MSNRPCAPAKTNVLACGLEMLLDPLLAGVACVKSPHNRRAIRCRGEILTEFLDSHVVRLGKLRLFVSTTTANRRTC